VGPEHEQDRHADRRDPGDPQPGAQGRSPAVGVPHRAFPAGGPGNNCLLRYLPSDGNPMVQALTCNGFRGMPARVAEPRKNRAPCAGRALWISVGSALVIRC
jgi:hypothetical protein